MMLRPMKRSQSGRMLCGCVRFSAIGTAILLAAANARAQIEITELMHSPAGSDRLWEWIEVHNTTAAAVNLNGWVFDDDDDPHVATANIDQAHGNTIVPARGVALLYAGDELDFMSQRFQNAWPSEIILIPLNGLTSLTPADAVGLWASREAYLADAIPMATTSPRRTFANAITAIAYTEENGFPAAASGHSIAWNGQGNATDGAQWVQSEEQVLGAVLSMESTIAASPINSASDIGNPGAVPAGAAASGLLITEIMFNPASPAATVGWSEADFEWVEVVNNTGSAIDFATTPHVFDDFVGDLDGANILSGTIAAGQVGVLYNGDAISAADMETMWGSGTNYIPVADWPSLNNSGDTIAIWDSSIDYHAEQIDGDNHRGTALATAAVTYSTLASEGWPTSNNQSSIYRNILSGDPNNGENWTRSGSNDDLMGSRQAVEILQTVVDNPGGDVGSPGFVPGSVAPAVPGDYNQNGIVDAADYVVWRMHLGPGSLPNEGGISPGSVDNADYDFWRSRFGATGGAGSGASPATAPASGVLLAMGLVGFACRRRRVSPRHLAARHRTSIARQYDPAKMAGLWWIGFAGDGDQLLADRFDFVCRELSQVVGEADQ